MKGKRSYIPGICNIGPSEIRMRAFIGWTGAIVTVALYVVLKQSTASRLQLSLVGLPASLAAIGFLQAARHFCVSLAVLGRYNFGESSKDSVLVTQTDLLALDRRKAITLLLQAASIGVVFGSIAYLLG